MKSRILITACFFLLLIVKESYATYSIYIRIGRHRTRLDVDASDTIDNVKTKLENKLGLPARRMRLFFGNRRLKENKTLADYNIDGSAVLRYMTK